MTLFFCINTSMADLTTNINYLQPTSYKLVLYRENNPNYEFFAQTVNHTGVGLNATEFFQENRGSAACWQHSVFRYTIG